MNHHGVSLPFSPPAGLKQDPVSDLYLPSMHNFLRPALHVNYKRMSVTVEVYHSNDNTGFLKKM
jgi:hypothetical protein